MEYGLLPPLRQFSIPKQHQAEVLPSAPLSSCSLATLGAPFVAAPTSTIVTPAMVMLWCYHWIVSFRFNVVGVGWCRRSERISDFLPSDCMAGERVSSTQLPADDSDVTPMMGSDVLHWRIRELFHEFRDIFSRTATSEPANVVPFELVVDTSQWYVKAHTKGPRLEPPVRNAEISRQVQLKLELGVIRRAEIAAIRYGRPHSDS
jgi:hypothetical protein